MATRYVRGNLFESETQQVLVNPTNARGPMGAGLARQFADRYPGLERAYRYFCEQVHQEQGRWPVGTLYAWQSNPPESQMIVCLPTKDHWRYPSRLEDIPDLLRALDNWANQYGYTQIAVPGLGTGLGGLKWPDVHALYEQILAPSLVSYEIFEPL